MKRIVVKKDQGQVDLVETIWQLKKELDQRNLLFKIVVKLFYELSAKDRLKCLIAAVRDFNESRRGK